MRTYLKNENETFLKHILYRINTQHLKNISNIFASGIYIYIYHNKYYLRY